MGPTQKSGLRYFGMLIVQILLLNQMKLISCPAEDFVPFKMIQMHTNVEIFNTLFTVS